MIIKGSQRGGARQLAAHLSNRLDNDHVELHQIRGFLSDTVEGALLESYAISKGTNADQHMFSVSFNPPPGKEVPIEDFEAAFSRVETKYGLSNHARVVVFHEKEARRHAHAVWCRIDHETMTAVNLPFFKRELREISRSLYIEHKWKMPPGLMNSKARISHEFTLAEWHQAKRSKLKPDALKSMFQECWAVSDSRQAFETVLRERGYFLARGDRRSFVAVDLLGNIYSLSRWTGVKRPELEDRLGEPSSFPAAEERCTEIARRFEDITKANLAERDERRGKLERELDTKRQVLVRKQRRERQELKREQDERLLAERRSRQQQLHSGLRGLWETISGRRKALLQAHRLGDKSSIRRDLEERQALIVRQLEERSRLQVFFQTARERVAEDISATLSLSSRGETHESPAARRVRKNPELILSRLTDQHAVFTRSAIARELESYFPDKTESRAALAKTMASNDLVELEHETGHSKAEPRYSTRGMIALERSLVRDGELLAGRNSSKVPKRCVENAIKREDALLKNKAGVSLSEEQKTAIRHITSNKQLTCVIGVAGAGKSTMLSAACKAWENAGHRVFGAALAGKAARGLEEASGIKSRTLASYAHSWEQDRNCLQRGDVFVIDEAEMIGSRQMAMFISEAKDKGAKIVLIGDADQLQPINAGAPFRVLADQLGCATLHAVHRQKDDWQRWASMQFAQGKVRPALEAYQRNSCVGVQNTHDEAVLALAQDYVSEPSATSCLALAHRRADVKAINDTVRALFKSRGELEGGIMYQTEHGKKQFAAGDRLLFTKNDRDLGVKNGMLGTVRQTSKNKLVVTPDLDSQSHKSADITIDVRDYASINHGYATTIHKSQGATVDQSFVLASRTMDRQLSYVAMTRHRRNVRLYAAKEEFHSFEGLCISLSRSRRKISTLDFDVKPHPVARDPVHDRGLAVLRH